MKIEVKKKGDIKKAKESLSLLPKHIKPLDLSKFAGKFKIKVDPLKLQQEWRDE